MKKIKPLPETNDLSLAFLTLYRGIGLMIEETYRDHTPPLKCLENVKNTGQVHLMATRKLFHEVKGD